MDNILFGFTFLFSLALTGLLWWSARRATATRPFWALLAAGWTVGLLGSAAWAAYEFVTGRDLPIISFVDGFYVVRYVLVWLAFWRCPTPWPWRGAWAMAGGMLAVALAGGLLVVSLVPAEPTLRLIAITSWGYPVLDAGVLFAVWRRWRDRRAVPFRRTVFILALAMLAYALANCANFGKFAFDWAAGPALSFALWFLSDVLALVAAVDFLRRGAQAGS